MTVVRSIQTLLTPDTVSRPLAAPGLISYRYRGRYGHIAIGATSHADALREAGRSIAGEPSLLQLDVWNGTSYEPVKGNDNA